MASEGEAKDPDPDLSDLPAFASLKLEFDAAMEDQARLCDLCGERILIQRKDHPTMHTACYSRSKTSTTSSEPSPLRSSSSSLESPTCTFCGAAIIIQYKAHPNLHTSCKRAMARGQQPAPLKSRQPQSNPSISQSFAEAEAFFEKSLPTSFASVAAPNSPPPRKDSPRGGLESSTEDLIASILRTSDFYEVLYVDLLSPLEIIKSNYKRLALRLHPDKCEAQDGEEAFKKISEAFCTLNDPLARRRYDASRSANVPFSDREAFARAQAFRNLSVADLQAVSGLFDKLFQDLNRALFGGH